MRPAVRGFKFGTPPTAMYASHRIMTLPLPSKAKPLSIDRVVGDVDARRVRGTPVDDERAFEVLGFSSLIADALLDTPRFQQLLHRMGLEGQPGYARRTASRSSH